MQGATFEPTTGTKIQLPLMLSQQLTLKQQLAAHMPQVYPIIRGSATVLIASLGMLLFGQVGSLAYPKSGMGAIVGCVFGGSLCLVIACCSTGFWKDVIPEEGYHDHQLDLPYMLAARQKRHGHFDLVVSVHRTEGVEVRGRLPLSPAQIYVEVQCGNNPVKCTCVRQDGKFDEEFKLHVGTSDQSLFVRIKDKGMFGTVDVGFVHVDIQRDIVDDSLLHEKKFDIQAGEGDMLRWTIPRACIVLSFDLERASNPMWFESGKEPSNGLAGHSGSYGAVSFISGLEFNPDARLQHDEDSMHTKVRHGTA